MFANSFKSMALVAFFMAVSVMSQAAIPYPSGCNACNSLGASIISECRTNVTSVDDNIILGIATCMCGVLTSTGGECGTCISGSPTHRETSATALFNQLYEACTASAAANDYVAAANVINPILRQSLSTNTIAVPSSTGASTASTTTSSAAITTSANGIGAVTATPPKSSATAPQRLFSTVVALFIIGFVASIAL
ncbi:hypothetical protein BC829DRAFT_395009 [Chytridium lagenaria]|nr:hypothetical protein BC829DRAFT_395009 [Chytridium lagenaria]